MWDKILCHVLEEWNPVILCCLLTVFQKNLLMFHPERGGSKSCIKIHPMWS